MATVKVKCPYCGSEEVSLCGKSSTGAQRYLYRNEACKRKTFQLEYKNNASKLVYSLIHIYSNKLSISKRQIWGIKMPI